MRSGGAEAEADAEADAEAEAKAKSASGGGGEAGFGTRCGMGGVACAARWVVYHSPLPRLPQLSIATFETLAPPPAFPQFSVATSDALAALAPGLAALASLRSPRFARPASLAPLRSPRPAGEGQTDMLRRLFSSLQPDAVAFGGANASANPARWVGTESGFAPYPCWSTTAGLFDSGAGAPDGAYFTPAETDFTLQNNDAWFYAPGGGVRPFAQLQSMYETSAGHNTALIVDFAPAPDGRIPPEQVATAAALGAYRRACYGAPVANASAAAPGQRVLTLALPAAARIDRVLVAEDQARGQIIRAFVVTATLADGSLATLVADGSSVGNKFIAVLPAPLVVTAVTLNITRVAAARAPGVEASVTDFAVFSCSEAAAKATADLEAMGFPQKAHAAESSGRKARRLRAQPSG